MCFYISWTVQGWQWDLVYLCLYEVKSKFGFPSKLLRLYRMTNKLQLCPSLEGSLFNLMLAGVLECWSVTIGSYNFEIVKDLIYSYVGFGINTSNSISLAIKRILNFTKYRKGYRRRWNRWKMFECEHYNEIINIVKAYLNHWWRCYTVDHST